VTLGAARIEEVMAQALQSGEADLALGLFRASRPAFISRLCVHAVATTPAPQQLGGWFRSVAEPRQPSPKGPSGRPAHCPFRGLLGDYSHCGLHTRHQFVTR
jgi:hypothetical protein